MIEPMTPAFICSTLVGRQTNLTALHMLIDRKSSGQGQAILICGEAGIGKSRLVAEAKFYAARKDFLLLEGQCFQTDSALPYAPLLDLFRSYFANFAKNSLAENMHSFVSTLSRLLPELALLFPDLAALPTSPSADLEEEKRRLFAAMTHFLSEQATLHPVLLIVEDIHWCDDLSLDFLLHLARRSQNIPLLLIVTYRSDELHPRLRRWLTQLDRERLAKEIGLERLSRTEVAAMLHDMLKTKQEVDADLLDTLFTRSEGNPFFVEELLKSLMTTGELVPTYGTWKRTTHRAPVPRSVQEAVQQRVVYLSADAKHLVTLAAVAGRRFNVTLLQEMMRCDEGQLLALLKEVMAAQLVVEEGLDQFAFRHALTQQAAIDHFTRAEEATHHLSQTPPSRLYLARGQAYETLGDFERARGVYERALDAARAAHDGTMEWQSMMAIGFLWTGHDYERAGVWFRQALALAEELADPTLHAQSLNRLGNWLVNTGRVQEALEAHQEALRLFEARADRQGTAQTLEMLGMAHFFMGDTAGAVKEFYGRTIELFRSLDDRQSLYSILAMRALDSAPETLETTYSALLTREECVRDAAEALLLARQTNSSAEQAFVEMVTSYVLSSFGAFGPALAHAQEALRIATAIEHQEWIVGTKGAQGLLYLLLLEPDRAVACLEAALAGAQAMGSAIQLKVLTSYLALAFIHRREFPRAEAVLNAVLPRDQEPDNFFERQVSRVWGASTTCSSARTRRNVNFLRPGTSSRNLPHRSMRPPCANGSYTPHLTCCQRKNLNTPVRLPGKHLVA